MIRIEIADETTSIYGPFKMEFLRLVGRLEGRKGWRGTGFVSIETSGANLKMLRDSGFEIDWSDTRGKLKELRNLEMLATQHSQGEALPSDYTPAMPYLKHMDHCLSLSWQRKAYMLAFEMGLCKTSTTIANFGILFVKGEITGVLISAPKGVHRQWVADEIPKHIDPRIKLNLILWDSKTDYRPAHLFKPGYLNVLSMNTDSFRTIAGQELASLFVRTHKGNVFFAVDESHDIKRYGSARSKEIIKVGQFCKYRRCLTGTPIAKSLEDMWSQFMFLDPNIIGINHLTLFRAEFSEMGGFENRMTVGSKNIEKFYSIIAPHCYRITKAEATDLPPKIYIERQYEMDAKTKSRYDDMKHSFMTDLDNGITIDAKTALDALTKMQRILSGYIVVDQKHEIYEPVSTQRVDILCDMLKQIRGQVIVWCRFIPDRKFISEGIREQLGEEVALLEDINSFQTRKKRISLLNPASGGTGLNLQFPTPGDNNAIYFNNSDRSIHRWQSEDRIWRVGMGGNATIWDIICHKSVDRGFLKRNKEKKDLADLTLDEIRQMINA